MKRFLALLLSVMMLLPFVVSCDKEELSLAETETAEQSKETEESVKEEEKVEETETKVGYEPQSQVEKNVNRILVIGNSGSNDVFFQLARVFAAQGYKGRYTLAFLYYSGCTFPKHVEFGTTHQEVYDYYESNSAEYTREEGCTLERALKKHQWDTILFQTARADFEDETLYKESRDNLMRFVDQFVTTEHNFGFMAGWPNPTAPELWSDTWKRKPPASAKERFEKNYGSDPVYQFHYDTDLVKKNVMTDERYSFVFAAGSAIVYANKVMGMSQLALYRDYTHLSDVGRLIASYTFYAAFTGEPIDEVKLDVLPAKKRQSYYQAEGDLIITDTLKEVIKESANYAFENMWTLPGE